MKTLLFVLIALMALAPTTAHATPITYTAVLNGPSEAPPNASPGTGFATVIFDDTAFTLEVIASFQGLVGLTSASHIHCCTSSPGTGTAGVATVVPAFPGFPFNVMSGNLDTILNLLSASAYNPAFVTANGSSVALAELALTNGLAAGDAYFNIHTSTFPGGEIRGFLQPAQATPVPEPGTMSLIGIGALFAARAIPERWRAARRRRSGDRLV